MKMLDRISLLFLRIRNLILHEEGQDLVEYSLLIALIALAASAGMKTLSSDLSHAFSTIGSTINGDV
jgi:pilus assembly protein Flp/PilA